MSLNNEIQAYMDKNKEMESHLFDQYKQTALMIQELIKEFQDKQSADGIMKMEARVHFKRWRSMWYQVKKNHIAYLNKWGEEQGFIGRYDTYLKLKAPTFPFTLPKV